MVFNSIDDFDVKFQGSYINEINLSNMQISFTSNTYFNEDISISSARVYFNGEKRFASGKNFLFTNSTLDNLSFGIYTDVTFDKISSDTNWQGLSLDGGGITLDKGTGYGPKIRNALTGIDIKGATEKVSIRNTKFENNSDYDISIYKISDEIITKSRISKNTFSQESTTNVKIASILLSECPNIGVDSNTITNTGYFGIILLNNEIPLLNSNSITGGNINGTHSSGIFSYNSNGYYKCNSIYQCMDYGILLDNSQPVLFNNVIGVNGIGLHLTNNSNPVLMPGYLDNETYVMGGYNFIHNNASEEIYCNNSKVNSSIPAMYKGNNGIVDENPNWNDILIYNEEVSGTAPTIDCPDNYWGGESPSGRLFPDYSFLYESYLTTILSYPCDFTSESADNESEPSEYLLLGNVLKNQYQENYNTALNYSNQLLALSNSNINPVISLNNLFTSTLFSNGNFTNLENYYLTLASQNSTDSVLSNASRNLAIESKIERNEIEPAITDYENIIFTSSDEELRFYASINRSRAIRLLLDSLLNHGGDNMPTNMDLENLYDKAIKYNAIGNSHLKKSNGNVNEKINRGNNKDNTGSINSAKTIKTNEIHFPFLQKRISDKIRSFNNLNENERRTLIIEKNILDLAENNYLDGIASIDDKLKFLNRGSDLSLKPYKLYQNYPNPFNPATTISYEIPISGLVKLKIYDLLGREVSVLINEFKEAGVYETEFNGTNFSSGIYFYKIESGDFVQVKRMVLIK